MANTSLRAYEPKKAKANKKDDDKDKKGLGQFYRKDDENGSSDFSTDEDLSRSQDGNDDFEDARNFIAPHSQERSADFF